MPARQRAPRGVGLATFLLLLLQGAQAASGPPLQMTAEEHSWVRSNQRVRVGVQVEFPPYFFSDTKGRYEGFVIDLMDRLAERLGVHFEYKRYSRVGDVFAAMRAREVEMTPFMAETPARRLYLRFVRPLFSTQTVYVADRRRGDISQSSGFAGERVAVERDSPAADLLRENFPRAMTVRYDTPEEAILAVAGGDADVYVGFRQVALYFMEKNFTANLALRGTIATPGTALGPAVREDLPLLATLLQKAIDDLSTDEVDRLAIKWLPRNVFGLRARSQIDLTPAQKDWVRTHRSLTLGFDSHFAPIAFVNRAGGFEGLAADYARTLAAKSGLIIASERGGSFAEVYEGALRGQIDVIAAAGRNADRQRDFDFVGPFLRVPAVIVAATDRALEGGLDDARGLRVAVLRNYFLLPQLRSRFPGLRPVEYDSQSATLYAVRRGDADAAIGNMKVVNALLEAEHIGALRIVGTVPEGDTELYFAVRNTSGELAAILQRAMEAITPQEAAQIEAKWLRLEVNVGIPGRRVLVWGGAGTLLTALVIGVLWISNRRLLQARTALQESKRLVEQENAARARFAAYLSHELRGSLGGLTSGLGIIERDSGASPQLIPMMRESAGALLALCERTLDFERSLKGGIDLKPEPIRVADAIRGALAPWRLQAQVRRLAFEDDLRVDPAQQANLDPVRFAQVLQNVVGNAVKYTESGGVSVQAQVQEPPDHGGASQPWLDIRVVDTGPGISAEERGRVFQPYSQGHAGLRARSGAGLGLSIVAQILAAMRGSIQIEDSSPKGTTFRIRVPLIPVEALTLTPAEA